MEQFFGKIEIKSVYNLQQEKADSEVLPILPDHHIRFVHYPDCQQLIIMLPSYGRDYRNIILRDIVSGAILDERPVEDRLSGSIQILWDTLEIAPGTYIIEIQWKDKQSHLIEFQKLAEESEAENNLKDTDAKTQGIEWPDPYTPIEYKDGFGNHIPDLAAEIRANAMNDLTRRFSRKITYKGNFRDGIITYDDGKYHIDFYHEMGGGGCHFYITIPSKSKWEAETGVPIAERQELIEFVAQQVQREQAPSWRYEIKEDMIGYY